MQDEGYQLVRQLGSGLSGVVYLSEAGTGKVAVRQFVSPSVPGTTAWLADREHFLTGGRQAAGLVQPRIVQILEVIDEEDDAFIAMEYVPNETLEAVLKRDSFSPEQANYLLRRMALALDYAHQKGITHGDFKPSNVFVLPDRSVKLADFCFSPRARRNRGPLPTPWVHPYISPEHFVSPETIGPRSDQYALAAIAYQLYTGRLLHWEIDPGDLRDAIVSGELVAPSSIHSHIPRTIDNVLLKALARDPRQRYASSTAFVDDLEAALASGVVAGPLVKKSPIPIPYLAGALAAILAVLAAILLFTRGIQPTKRIDPGPAPSAVTPPSPAAAIVKPPGQSKSTAQKRAARQTTQTTEKVSPRQEVPVATKVTVARAEPAPPVSRPAPDAPAAGTSSTGRPEPLPALGAQNINLGVFSRTRKIENGISFAYHDPVLGEMGHGDLTAVVQTNAAPKGKLTLEWVVDDIRMDFKQVVPNRPTEFANEPTPGSYRLILRLDSKPLTTFVFRITP